MVERDRNNSAMPWMRLQVSPRSSRHRSHTATIYPSRAEHESVKIDFGYLGAYGCSLFVAPVEIGAEHAPVFDWTRNGDNGLLALRSRPRTCSHCGVTGAS